MRALALTLTLILSPIVATYANPGELRMQSEASWPEQISYDIPVRLLQMPAPFAIEFNPEVGRQITDYLRQGRRETEKMLARTALYFPIFEYYLHKYQLPDELKYVPLLESRLRPTAESAAGAVGLWQFMPATADHYRLRIDAYVDERMNPYLATEAAVSMLSGLYEELGDWSLVLAAYNCGPGRVRSAVRRTGCHNFWDIQHLLPRQTQRYLPALIATIYVARNYGRHGLEPNSKKPIFQPFQVFKVQHSLDLNDIARHCKVSRQLLSRLNPGFLQDFIPNSARGLYLILPQEALANFQQYIIKESRKSTESYAIAVLASHQPPPVSNGLTAKIPKTDI
ncbi:MAG: lytic transglycosylase domain-containing protein [Lewinellaceae bacterium]|nr:lytic transglycosylase domain-containing protein [Phaeodactylibacter sp.]MCB0612706.1 lytic transglycosylase domain-containing protein [Phaeodactylibacter sp.]MCB9348111.1 lytic transglycosylase domain-containing protein [Lewinellaceae bacterium]